MTDPAPEAATSQPGRRRRQPGQQPAGCPAAHGASGDGAFGPAGSLFARLPLQPGLQDQYGSRLIQEALLLTLAFAPAATQQLLPRHPGGVTLVLEFHRETLLLQMPGEVAHPPRLPGVAAVRPARQAHNQQAGAFILGQFPEGAHVVTESGAACEPAAAERERRTALPASQPYAGLANIKCQHRLS